MESTIQLFRRTAETDGNGDVTTFEYDLADNLTKLTDPNGSPTSWTIDDSDRVHIETDVFNNPRTYLYDAVGNERKMTDRRGLVTEYHYDNLYRLTGETWKDASDNQVRQLDFSYDLVDNLLTATDPSASYTYAYDNLDRPTTETQNLTAFRWWIRKELGNQIPLLVIELQFGFHLGPRVCFRRSLTGTVRHKRTPFYPLLRTD